MPEKENNSELNTMTIFNIDDYMTLHHILWKRLYAIQWRIYKEEYPILTQLEQEKSEKIKIVNEICKTPESIREWAVKAIDGWCKLYKCSSSKLNFEKVNSRKSVENQHLRQITSQINNQRSVICNLKESFDIFFKKLNTFREAMGKPKLISLGSSSKEDFDM